MVFLRAMAPHGSVRACVVSCPHSRTEGLGSAVVAAAATSHSLRRGCSSHDPIGAIDAPGLAPYSHGPWKLHPRSGPCLLCHSMCALRNRAIGLHRNLFDQCNNCAADLQVPYSHICPD